MFEKLITSYKEFKIAKEERKRLEVQRKMDLEKQQYTLKMERMKLEARLLKEGKVLPPENLDKLSMEQMEKSWKDEFIMFILFSPLILAFIPGIQSVVSEGFKILKNDLPEWYMYFLAGIMVVTYGLRGLVRLALSKQAKIPLVEKKSIE